VLNAETSLVVGRHFDACATRNGRLCTRGRREEWQLKPGDEIVSVNGVCSSLEGMLAELQQGHFPKELKMSLVRWEIPPKELKGQRAIEQLGE